MVGTGGPSGDCGGDPLREPGGAAPLSRRRFGGETWGFGALCGCWDPLLEEGRLRR